MGTEAAPMFADRHDAGRQLGVRLASNLPPANYLVAGLLRGGVPIAAEVAEALGAPVAAMTVRKLGVPGFAETAFGALASYRGSLATYLNPAIHAQVLADFGRSTVEKVEGRARTEADRLARVFADYAPPLAGATLVLCDDGLATGATMKAALLLAHRLGAHRLIAAVPVAPATSPEELAEFCDAYFALHLPQHFGAVGRFYDRFDATSEQQALALLRATS
ncbi:phosphoribosyl transferase [Arthrobacter sp. MYb224]|uniref:phosphoribosyltransferase n=1 Tax=Micrococcaceae TaxID=1268 RepID=UPI000CFB15F1|nr:MULTISPECIES: phosphoribosyltransferase family protein [unclassified Arthrobacter]PQZ95715.1 phosphoribosyl transferase [Arthrobacter sp. MYb224]PQZ97511.1 phosphoribosyl transferase [Arthrobacter sp. MYb229]PRB46557.1 phosphoribosyl transferase [Arthrobacter sp. MYb216]